MAHEYWVTNSLKLTEARGWLPISPVNPGLFGLSEKRPTSAVLAEFLTSDILSKLPEPG